MLLAQSAIPLIHSGWEFAGLVAILIFQFYQAKQTKDLRKGVNGRLEELLHTTRMRAHADGHREGIQYEQERKRLQLEDHRAAEAKLAKIKSNDPDATPATSVDG